MCYIALLSLTDIEMKQGFINWNKRAEIDDVKM